MVELVNLLQKITTDDVRKMVISKPALKKFRYKKIVIEKREAYYQACSYTEKQVFHENIPPEDLGKYCLAMISNEFRQVNAWGQMGEHIILISKSGSCSYKMNQAAGNVKGVQAEHNRKKKYILEEGMRIEPLADMGIFTKEGKVVRSMYDKYKQINRFLEILNDEIEKSSLKKLNIIDFGCGKSYLTFIVYFYLTQIRKLEVNMIGLDLKEDVIRKCNEAAKKYGYGNLKFEIGDIGGYHAPFPVDMVITLHACDTATDLALYNAIKWDAKMIFSVPCCQHELNRQIKAESLSILTNYGIIKERFCALATDAIRANLLEYCGYKTQLLEFIDFEHTPKNILIRAVKRPMTPKGVREKALSQVNVLMEEFDFRPMLYHLLLP
ncbi:SAM-dependent methyltransferase [Lachnospiraceae bacterium]|nr:SAM-dependent methyltransferase [Lachnospiraceae bacterium]